MIQKFNYSIIAKIVYRYANLFVTFVLLSHFLLFAIAPNKNWTFLLLGFVNIILIYVVNRFYFNIYKYFPFDIQTDDEKIVCQNFVIKNREETIKFSEIEKISGGIFDKKPSTPIYIHFRGTKIGVNIHLKNFQKFLTTVLQRVDQKVYDNLLDSVKLKTEVQVASLKSKVAKIKNKKSKTGKFTKGKK